MEVKEIWLEAFNFARVTPSAKTVQIGSLEHLQGRKAENSIKNIRNVSKNFQCSLKHLFSEKAIQLVMIFAFSDCPQTHLPKDLLKFWSYLLGILKAF